MTDRVRSAAVAVATAASVEYLFDLAFSMARGTQIEPGYLALCAFLLLAATSACILPALFARGSASASRAALALYVLAHGAAGPGVPSGRFFAAAAMGGATWLWFSLRPGREMPPARRGALVGSALCLAIAVWRYSSVVWPLWLWYGDPAALDPSLVFVSILAALGAWEIVRPRVLPSSATLAMAAIALSVVVMAHNVHLVRPQATALTPMPAPSLGSPLPPIFLLVLDTVRADHLSSYGYERDTTPNLVRFLAQHPEAVRYDLAFSTASWTIPAHGALLSGTMQSIHGARGYSATKPIDFRAKQTLAEAARDAGYCTAAVVANPFLLRVAGFRRGFAVFFQPRAIRPLLLLGEWLRDRFFPDAYAGRLGPYPLADVINAQVRNVYRECGARPPFLLVNYMDAHSPYLAPEPDAGRFAGEQRAKVPLEDATTSDSEELLALKRDRYDEEIHFLDAQLQNLFDRLERDEKMQGSWLFITSDHGEAFGEHGVTSHGSGIYNEEVRVPLIIKPPRGVPLRETRDPVSLLDVATTIAGIAGRPGFGTGRDLRAPAVGRRAVGIEFQGTFRSAGSFGPAATDPARAAVRGHWKLLARSGRYELYDLAADPRELDDRGAQYGGIVRAIAEDLPPPQSPTGSDVSRDDDEPTQQISRDEIEMLRELGYGS